MLILCLGLAWPGPALAGAWARGAGEAFVSLKGAAAPRSRDEMKPTFALYGEYGLTPRLTLGASYDKLDAPLSLAKVFGRWNLTAPEATWQIALEAGAGVEFDDTALGFGRIDVWRPGPDIRTFEYYDSISGQTIRLPADLETVSPNLELVSTEYEPRPTAGTVIAALHLGRGFGTPLGDAWVDVRLGVDMSMEDRPALAKIDAVAGLSVLERGFVSLELRAARSEAFHSLLAVPAIGYEIRPGLHATLGAILDTRGAAPARLEVGTWVSF